MTIRSLFAHKLRLASTVVAVVLGVSFVAGTFVLGDTLQHTFDTLFSEVSQGVDVAVRATSGVNSTESLGMGDRETVPESLLGAVRSVDGVKYAEGSVGGYAQLVDKAGHAVVTQSPTIGASMAQHDELVPLRITEGRRPQGNGEVVIDRGTAQKYDFRPGDTVKILLQGPARTFRVVGIVRFGAANNLAGATLVAFDTKTAQTVFGKPNRFDSIDVAAKSGVSADQLRSRISQVLPRGYEAITGKKVADESAKAVKQGLSFFSTFLLVFAGIALFVGSFIIFNTFSIIIAQRARELALLRAVGATRRQVTTSVLGEALVVSLLASIVGLGLGVLVAVGLTALLRAVGVDLPHSSTQFLPRTAIVSILTGVVVTCVAAFMPARKAGRVPPVAAMRESIVEPSHSLRRRLATGGVVAAVGLGMLVLGLFGGVDNGIVLVGLGAAVAFVGVAMLTPIVARPLAAAIGLPLPPLFGVAGRMARENAVRNPRRTASSASALMIGIGLVTAVTVLATSAKASVDSAIDRSLGADYILRTKNFSNFSPELALRLARQPGIQAASGLRTGMWQYNGSTKWVNAADPSALEQVIPLELSSGSVSRLDHGEVLISETELRNNGWKLGQKIPMQFARTGVQQIAIGGVYKRNPFVDNYLISAATYAANFTQQMDLMVVVKAAKEVSPQRSRAVVDQVLKDFPNVEAQDQAQFKQASRDQVNQMLGMVYALLGLAIVIALIGIMNTMALSVMERTRELGLLRAVGMSRRQTRRMIRWESVVVSLLGACLGLAVGVAFGAAIVAALHDKGITALRLPVGSLVVFLFVAGMAGVLAAIAPARRAARLDVLAAVTTE